MKKSIGVVLLSAFLCATAGGAMRTAHSALCDTEACNMSKYTTLPSSDTYAYYEVVQQRTSDNLKSLGEGALTGGLVGGFVAAGAVSVASRRRDSAPTPS